MALDMPAVNRATMSPERMVVAGRRRTWRRYVQRRALRRSQRTEIDADRRRRLHGSRGGSFSCYAFPVTVLVRRAANEVRCSEKGGPGWWSAPCPRRDKALASPRVSTSQGIFGDFAALTGPPVSCRPSDPAGRRPLHYEEGPVPGDGLIVSRSVVSWREFSEQSPRVAEVFVRRHSATRNLCLLATLRSDGYPRISPMEPRIVEGELVLVGMPNTSKFRDLGRDPRFCLHTATADPYVGDGDAKLWGNARNVQDKGLHERFAVKVVEEGGPDLRGQTIDPFYVADISGASCIEVVEGQLNIAIWKPGEGERSRRLT
ncbi:MAG TPA: pyridoxamine 5'-phosphate oxidase family protein [Acidimicrobiales bacterium]|nr:pyridoxamine 5'-phosphate oxidase family protein [Acidimicrobiales bacterium]